MRRRSFTLIELLVVITVISILAGILLPALKRAKESVYLTVCLNKTRQIYTAVAVYSNDNDGWLFPRNHAYVWSDGYGNSMSVNQWGSDFHPATYAKGIGNLTYYLLLPHYLRWDTMYCPQRSMSNIFKLDKPYDVNKPNQYAMLEATSQDTYSVFDSGRNRAYLYRKSDRKQILLSSGYSSFVVGAKLHIYHNPEGRSVRSSTRGAFSKFSTDNWRIGRHPTNGLIIDASNGNNTTPTGSSKVSTGLVYGGYSYHRFRVNATSLDSTWVIGWEDGGARTENVRAYGPGYFWNFGNQWFELPMYNSVLDRANLDRPWMW